VEQRQPFLAHRQRFFTRFAFQNPPYFSILWQTTKPSEITEDADLYIFSLKDDILHEMIRRIRPNGRLWVHTSGMIITADVSAGHVKRYGVFYLFQTFTEGDEGSVWTGRDVRFPKSE
jgi:hypothetical protein